MPPFLSGDFTYFPCLSLETKFDIFLYWTTQRKIPLTPHSITNYEFAKLFLTTRFIFWYRNEVLSFEGCIGNIRFNRIPNGPLERARLRTTPKEAINNCTGACAARPQRCANRGRCVDYIKYSECDCTGTGYEGGSCETRKIVKSYHTHSFSEYSFTFYGNKKSHDHKIWDKCPRKKNALIFKIRIRVLNHSSACGSIVLKESL